MDITDLTRMKAVAEAATPGPWRFGVMSFDHPFVYAAGLAVAHPHLDDDEPARAAGIADHIATFDPPTVLALIAEVQRARAEGAAEVRAAVEALANEWATGCGAYGIQLTCADWLRAAISPEGVAAHNAKIAAETLAAAAAACARDKPTYPSDWLRGRLPGTWLRRRSRLLV